MWENTLLKSDGLPVSRTLLACQDRSERRLAQEKSADALVAEAGSGFSFVGFHIGSGA